ncbi:MAG: hypothetical protein MI799_15315 [Desulfobacterales bacterium]|nr:hypothetical protein [Desulfobacterales bacterium]
MKLFFSITLCVLLYGCANNIPTLEQRLKTAVNIGSNLKTNYMKTENFTLFSLQQLSEQCENIHIYIEGDGFAWVTKSKISNNPTPINPVALKLMEQDNSPCKIYLARPCQYTESALCERKYWTSGRFHFRIIQSYQTTLDTIKKKYKNTTFKLIGYSGGAAIALLIAAKRDDINQVITVAGNLDHATWTKLHNITPLTKSLNPIDYTNHLKTIDQLHLIGSKDMIIPRKVTQSYINKFPLNNKMKLIHVNSDHTCCWYKTFFSIINSKE